VNAVHASVNRNVNAAVVIAIVNKMYSKKVLKIFQNPKFAGEIKNADAVGEVGGMKCGDIMRIYLKIDRKTKKIKDIKFKTYGCIAAISASDAMCKLVKGKTLKQALKISAKDIVKELGGELPAIKFHCSVLGTEALKKAVGNYYKNEKRNRKT
jgi:nitrogen fixation NifU-like protein